jgi:hypothetical protein
MGIVAPFPLGAGGKVAFDRAELTRILDLYGRMVAAGHWRDYAMDMGKDAECSVPIAGRQSGQNSALKSAQPCATDKANGRLLGNMVLS